MLAMFGATFAGGTVVGSNWRGAGDALRCYCGEAARFATAPAAATDASLAPTHGTLPVAAPLASPAIAAQPVIPQAATPSTRVLPTLAKRAPVDGNLRLQIAGGAAVLLGLLGLGFLMRPRRRKLARTAAVAAPFAAAAWAEPLGAEAYRTGATELGAEDWSHHAAPLDLSAYDEPLAGSEVIHPATTQDWSYPAAAHADGHAAGETPAELWHDPSTGEWVPVPDRAPAAYAAHEEFEPVYYDEPAASRPAGIFSKRNLAIAGAVLGSITALAATTGHHPLAFADTVARQAGIKLPGIAHTAPAIAADPPGGRTLGQDARLAYGPAAPGAHYAPGKALIAPGKAGAGIVGGGLGQGDGSVADPTRGEPQSHAFDGLGAGDPQLADQGRHYTQGGGFTSPTAGAGSGGQQSTAPASGSSTGGANLAAGGGTAASGSAGNGSDGSGSGNGGANAGGNGSGANGGNGASSSGGSPGDMLGTQDPGAGDATPVPEPGTIGLFVLGVGALAVARRRRRPVASQAA